MPNLSSLLVLLTAIVVSHDVATGTGGTCDGANTTRELEACLAAELKAAEKDLDRYYSESRKVLAGRDDVLGALDRAQSAWAGFRDADCDATYRHNADGSLASAQGLGCKLTHTRRRIRDLWSEYLRGAATSKLPEPPNPGWVP